MRALTFINAVVVVVLAGIVGYFISVAISINNEKQQTKETMGNIYHVHEPRS